VKPIYRGEPSVFDWSVALGQLGSIQIELLQQHGDEASVVREQYARGQSGILHVARFVANVLEEIDRLQAVGFETVHLNEDQNGFPVAWVDTRKLMGTMVELFQEEPLRRARFRSIAQAASGWNGENPLREVS
jgi:hypothetical protein